MKDKLALTNTVNQANELSQRLRYHDKLSVLTAQEKNIIFLLASCIDPKDKSFQLIHIKISEFVKLLHINLNGGKQRQLLEESLYRLRTKGFIVVSKNGKRKDFGCWLSRATIDYATGYISLQLDDSLRPFFLNLRESARTIFQLGYTVLFKKKHSCDLYALCKSAAGLKYWIIPYDELQGILGGGYERYYNLQQRVLIPCIEEINNYSDIVVEFQPIKENNKIISVAFKIRNKTYNEKIRLGIEKVKFPKSKLVHDSQFVIASVFPELLQTLDTEDNARLDAKDKKIRTKIIKQITSDIT